MESTTRAARAEALLRQRFQPDALTVEDESHLHAGHAGWAEGGGSHLRVRIVAAAFAGQTRLARHRRVNDALAPEFADGLHALAVEARAPGEPDRRSRTP